MRFRHRRDCQRKSEKMKNDNISIASEMVDIAKTLIGSDDHPTFMNDVMNDAEACGENDGDSQQPLTSNNAIAKELTKVARILLAGEIASKDGKYGKKNEGWNGTIDYNGTKGVVSNAIFELKNGRIVWTDGTWHSGTWSYGLWKDGLWKDGIWQMGEWENGIWQCGTWMYGTWHYGIWKQEGKDNAKSIWQNGTWKNGIWENGIHENGWWEKGIWQQGTWNGGTFWTGTWDKGTWNGGLNWYGEFSNCVWNSGQWNEGTWHSGVWKGGFDKQKNWHPEGASPNKWTSESK